MSTRLYPLTSNPEQLEFLAGVPYGTYAKLQAFKKRKPVILYTIGHAPVIDQDDSIVGMPVYRVLMPSGNEIDANTAEQGMGGKCYTGKRDWGYALHCDLQTMPDLAKLDTFEIFGWGRVGANLKRLGVDPNRGSVGDPGLVYRIMRDQFSVWENNRRYIGQQTRFFWDDITYEDIGCGVCWS